MHHSLLVQVPQCVCKNSQHFGRLSLREKLLLQELVQQFAAVHELHDHVDYSAVVVHLNTREHHHTGAGSVTILGERRLAVTSDVTFQM